MIHPVHNQASEQRVSRGYLIQIVLVFIAYLVAGKLGQATTNIRSSNLGPVWPAYGVALAAILICGYRVWLGVAAGAFLVAFFSPVAHVAALGQAAGATIAAVTGAFLLHRFTNFDRSLSRLSDAFSLIALGGLSSAIVSASIGVLVLYATGVHAYSGWGAAWVIYWLGDATGVLLITPLALRFTDFSELRDRGRITELAILLLLLAATSFVIFSDLHSIPVKLHLMAFAVLPFIIWAAIRFGVGVTALSILVVAAIATVETALGSGPFSSNTTFENAVLLDVYFAVLSVSGLSLAAVISEREHAEHQREQAVSKQATMEARLQAAQALQLSEQRWHLAAQAGKMYAYEWDVATDAVVQSSEVASVLGQIGQASILTRQQILASVHPDDRARFTASTTERTPGSPDTQINYRVLRPDGSVIWLEKTARAFFGRDGRMVRMVGMVTDITERKQAEDRLREYEKAVEGADEMIAVVDRKYRYLIANRRFLSLRNMRKEQVVGQFAHEVLNDGVFEAVVKGKLDKCFEGNVVRFEMKYTYPELGERSLLVSYFPIEGANGIDRVACILQDVTDRKQAEEALATMSRKLIEAQEQERARIARELHDDINQRLALLAFDIEESKQNLPTSAEDMTRLLTEVSERIDEVSSEVQSISHQLHYSQLEHLGIVAAVKSFCRDVTLRQKVEIDFTHDDIPRTLPQEIALCLFRVLQEALHNAVKHSNVRHFEVRLGCSANELHLIVSDRGTGFEIERATNKGGLGLISMQERVRLVNGTIAIESKPMGGTTIHVRVPFDLACALQRATG